MILFIYLLSLSLFSYEIPDSPEDCSPLLIGEEFPMEEVLDIKGNKVDLDDIIDDKKTIIVFYRGGWCPYCNQHLSALAQVEKEIIELGYNIIAISPDDFQNIKDVDEEHDFNYKLFSDIDGNLMKKVGIAYKTPFTNKIYIKAKTKGEVSGLLPVPSLFVLNEDGDIIFEYIHLDYKIRITEDLLLAVLKNLKTE